MCGNGRGVLSGLAIQEPIIHTHTQTAVLLLNKHNWRGVGTAALPNNLHTEQLINVVFNDLIL